MVCLCVALPPEQGSTASPSPLLSNAVDDDDDDDDDDGLVMMLMTDVWAE